ncbi:MAG: response regulator transcription factor [Bacteroidales bacterium]|nr:response regulator transcription factor [Bacteroidales bacterium]
MRVLIIEDEIMARRSLERTLEANFPDMEIVGELGSVRESVEWIKGHTDGADTIFMDVELSDGECFEIFRQVEIRSHVVMTTAYDNYAVKAFEAGSVDYLLKPIELSALSRAVERCGHPAATFDVDKILGALTEGRKAKEYKERLLVHLNDRIVPVKTADIAFFFSEDKNNHVVTHEGSVYIVDATLDTIMAGLDPERFFKISRSCVFAKDAVHSVTKLLGGRLRVSPKTAFPKNLGAAPDLTVSRSRSEDFLSWLER